MEYLYERLCQNFDKHRNGCPAHPTILGILKEIFAPEEVRLALCVSFKGLELEEIAKRTGLSQIEKKSLLEKIAYKGIIFCKKSRNRIRYALMPPMPGFFEFSLIKDE